MSTPRSAFAPAAGSTGRGGLRTAEPSLLLAGLGSVVLVLDCGAAGI
jgi:hypothetical protein